MSETFRSSAEKKYGKKTKFAAGLLAATGLIGGLSACGDNKEAAGNENLTIEAIQPMKTPVTLEDIPGELAYYDDFDVRSEVLEVANFDSTQLNSAGLTSDILDADMKYRVNRINLFNLYQKEPFMQDAKDPNNINHEDYQIMLDDMERSRKVLELEAMLRLEMSSSDTASPSSHNINYTETITDAGVISILPFDTITKSSSDQCVNIQVVDKIENPQTFRAATVNFINQANESALNFAKESGFSCY
jgi:hypothetical protein